MKRRAGLVALDHKKIELTKNNRKLKSHKKAKKSSMRLKSLSAILSNPLKLIGMLFLSFSLKI